MSETVATTVATTSTSPENQKPSTNHFSIVDFATIVLAIIVAGVRAYLRYKKNGQGSSKEDSTVALNSNNKRQLFLVDLFTAALIIPFFVMALAPFYPPALKEITEGGLKVFVSLGAIGVLWFVLQEIVRPLNE